MDNPQVTGSGPENLPADVTVQPPETKPPDPEVKPEGGSTAQGGATLGINVGEGRGQTNAPGNMRDANSYFNEYLGNVNKFRDVYFNHVLEGSSPHQQEETKPLIDLTSELPQVNPDTCCPESTLIQQYHDALKTSRLLLISCADKQIASSSAYAIVDAMGQVDAALQRRFLDFERIATSNVQPSVFLLRSANESNGEDGQKNGEVVIVVDTIGRHQDSKAQKFLNSLMGTSFPVLSADLQQTQVSLLCLVDAETIQARVQMTIDGQTFEDALPCPHWEVPFLGALLKQHFPETYEQVKIKIEQQRGRWSTNERRFWIDIKQLIKRNHLLSLLETPYGTSEIGVESLFNDDDINQDIRLVVLFVAAFWPNLNPREFHRVVSLLLGDRTRTITVPTTRVNDKGITETIDVKEEKSLLEIWEQRSDKIKEECHLQSVPDTEVTRVIDFTDHRLRSLIKQRLEQDYSFFTNTQIERSFSAGLLFDTSPRISESLVAITAAAAASDPDYYGTELLLDTATKFERACESDDAASIHKVAPFQLLVDLGKTEASLRVYHRVAYLLRILLDQYKLHPAVHVLLEQLVRREFYDAVFKIVVRLRFAKGFDEFHWLKQLIERGDDAVELKTLLYLHGYLKNMGTKVYQVLAGLDSWLPKYENKKDQSTAAPEKAPSASGKYALNLFMYYCTETTVRLDAATYGAWPSRHPLFVFPDVETATSNLTLLARWLFHPWITDAFPKDESEENSGDINELICDLIYHWMLVLFGPPRDESDWEGLEKPTPGPNAITVSQILIQQVVANATEERRNYMLTRWQAASELMLFIIKKLPYGDEAREEMIWQRSLLDDLIARFKDYAEAAENSQAA